MNHIARLPPDRNNSTLDGRGQARQRHRLSVEQRIERADLLGASREWLALLSSEKDIDDLNQMRAEFERFSFVVEDAKRHFGQWDMFDPVVWAILRVVQAQNDLAHAFDQFAAYGTERMVEQAGAGRIVAIAALQKAIEEEPRGLFF